MIGDGGKIKNPTAIAIEDVLLHLFPAATSIVIDTRLRQFHTSGRERFANGVLSRDPGHLLCLVAAPRRRASCASETHDVEPGSRL